MVSSTVRYNLESGPSNEHPKPIMPKLAQRVQ